MPCPHEALIRVSLPAGTVRRPWLRNRASQGLLGEGLRFFYGKLKHIRSSEINVSSVRPSPALSSFNSTEDRIAPGHPIRQIEGVSRNSVCVRADERGPLRQLAWPRVRQGLIFGGALHFPLGCHRARPSIPPEQLILALLMKAFFVLCLERNLWE